MKDYRLTRLHAGEYRLWVRGSDARYTWQIRRIHNGKWQAELGMVTLESTTLKTLVRDTVALQRNVNRYAEES